MRFLSLFLLVAVWAANNSDIWVDGTAGNDGNQCTGQGSNACKTLYGAYGKGNNNTIIFTASQNFSQSAGLDPDTPVPPFLINSTHVGYTFKGDVGVQPTLVIDRWGPFVILPPNQGAYVVLQSFTLFLNISHNVTLIVLGSNNKYVNIISLTVSQNQDPTLETPLVGLDFLSNQGGNVTINGSTFTNFRTDTVLIFNREPTNNSTVSISNTTFANLFESNALYYDYGWNNNFARTIFTGVTFQNITADDIFFGEPHPGLIDVDLVYTEQKVFNMSNCAFKLINLDFLYAAPLYFSVEWETQWVVPIFYLTNVSFSGNIARECGGIAVNMAMSKDYLRLNLTQLQFHNNSVTLPPGFNTTRPGTAADLFLGGYSHTYANITDSCSNSCPPRVDVDNEESLLPNCLSRTPEDIDPTKCVTFISQTELYVSPSGDDIQQCSSGSPCKTIFRAISRGNNLTIHVRPSSGSPTTPPYDCPTIFINSLNDGYRIIGDNSPFGGWNQRSVLVIQNFSSAFILLNYPFLFLFLENLEFVWVTGVPDMLIMSQSQFGIVNITNVLFRQSPIIDTTLHVSFIELFKGEVYLENVLFDRLESQGTIIRHTSFGFNIFNATNVNFTNIQLTGGYAHIFDDLESEFDGLAFHGNNMTVENITRERSGEHGYDFALIEFSGSSFSAEFTPEVVFFNCTFRSVYIPSDSMILFDVPKEPIFINCTFTNNTARRAGCITAVAAGAFVRLYGCQFFANRGSVPQESFNDINIGSDALLYEPYDFGGTCSRSCQPRTSFTLAFFFMNCTSTKDKDGQGEIDESTCPPFMRDLYVDTAGNNTRDCLSNSTACQSIGAALFKGMNNRIHIGKGDFECPPVVIGDSQGGFLLLGTNDWTNSTTQTRLILNFTEHIFTLRDFPGVYLELEGLRLYLNASSLSPRYVINIATTEDFEGNVNIFNVRVSHNETARGFNFISMNSGRVNLRNVHIHDIFTFRPIIFCQNHFFFHNNTFFCHNVSIVNVQLGGMSSIFDSGGFFHENYTLLLLENFTATMEANFSFGGLFQISDDVSIFNFTSSTLRNITLSTVYQAPIIYHNISETREFNFLNVTFTSNTAEFSGGIMMHESSVQKLRIGFCRFYNNTGLSPQEGVADLHLDWDKGLYSPFDIGFSCSRSCGPRINRGELILLPTCIEEADPDGKGNIDLSQCKLSQNSAWLFVLASGGNDNNNCLSFQAACATITGAIGKGWNNMILLSVGSFVAPVVSLNWTIHRGFSIIGGGDEGAYETDVYINVAETLFTIPNFNPGVYIFLERFRFLLNSSRSDYLIKLEAEIDFMNLVEVNDVNFTQQAGKTFQGMGFISFFGGEILLRNVIFDYLIGDSPLVSFVGKIRFEPFPYQLNFYGVNITNIKVNGDFPLFDDLSDANHTHSDVGFENCLIQDVTTYGNSAGKNVGLFNFYSESNSKPVDIINTTFRRINLGSVYLAPIYFHGVFGGNRAIVNCTFSHNTAKHCGGISDGSETLKLRILFCGFFDNHFTGAGGANDLALGTLSDTYTAEYILASCGNSNKPRITTTLAPVEALLTNCDEPLPPSEGGTVVQVKKKTSAGVVVTIVILVLVVVAAAAIAIAIFIWYRKKKNAGYQFIGPDKRANSVNNAEFDVESRK